MNQKQWIVAGIILIALLLLLIFPLLGNPSQDAAATNQNGASANLAYCIDEQVKPCVVSFSTDANDNMLVNLLLPSVSFPKFYLTISRGDAEIRYACQRLREAINSAYCVGEKVAPGGTYHLTLVSINDSFPLAQGDITIIGLAQPTIGVVTQTITLQPTVEVGTQTVTPQPNPSPTPTQTQQVYPNP